MYSWITADYLIIHILRAFSGISTCSRAHAFGNMSPYTEYTAFAISLVFAASLFLAEALNIERMMLRAFLAGNPARR